MNIFLGILSAVAILAISLIHFYWALGGRKWADRVFPQFAGTDIPVFTAGNWATTLVAFIFLGFAGVIFLKTLPTVSRIPVYWTNIGAWAIAALFLLRAVGDFKYVGFTKTIHSTNFAAYDTNFFTPLSLTIGLMIVVMALI